MAVIKAIAIYLFNVLIALDRLTNAIIRGNPDETLSSVSYRKDRDNERWGFLRPVIDKIFWFEPHHCAVAYSHDRHPVLAP